tara:strand:+ start:1171 stop:1473 length:303 start_codon:yes stop_codon:yes gene_type:complete
MLPDWQSLEAYCDEGLRLSGMTVVSKTHHQFDPQGITGLWVLAESHFALHTYPEHRFLAMDIFTCGDRQTPEQAIDYVCDQLGIEAQQRVEIERGVLRYE